MLARNIVDFRRCNRGVRDRGKTALSDFDVIVPHERGALRRFLAEHGEERTAETGEILFNVGDKSYPFMAIIEGEAAIRDESGRELISHGPSGFVGELNLLTGQTVFLTAIATKPMRYIAVPREELRSLLVDLGAQAFVLVAGQVQRKRALSALDRTLPWEYANEGLRDLVDRVFPAVHALAE